MSERIYKKANDILNKKASEDYGEGVKEVELINQQKISTERDSKLREAVKKSNKDLRTVLGYSPDRKNDADSYFRSMTIFEQCKFRLHRLRGKLTAVTGEDENHS